MVIGAYGVMRVIFAAFNVGFGGVAGFVRPVVIPMAVGSIEAAGNIPNESHIEDIKGMGAGMENITWFFGQVLFVGGSGALLVQSTLQGLGYTVELLDLAAVEIPVAIFATMFQCGSKRTMDAEEITVPCNVLCAHAAVWARNNADLTVQVGKARRLFYEEVLPACSYKQSNEVECIELYGPASRQNMPMLDLYFPFEVISGEKE